MKSYLKAGLSCLCATALVFSCSTMAFAADTDTSVSTQVEPNDTQSITQTYTSSSNQWYVTMDSTIETDSTGHWNYSDITNLTGTPLDSTVSWATPRIVSGGVGYDYCDIEVGVYYYPPGQMEYYDFTFDLNSYN